MTDTLKTTTIHDDLLAEGIHVAFRKASDHPVSARVWNAIHDLPAREWSSIIDFILSGAKVSDPALDRLIAENNALRTDRDALRKALEDIAAPPAFAMDSADRVEGMRDIARAALGETGE